jgi:hypothetical protein
MANVRLFPAAQSGGKPPQSKGGPGYKPAKEDASEDCRDACNQNLFWDFGNGGQQGLRISMLRGLQDLVSGA